jgi:hypothetical protein
MSMVHLPNSFIQAYRSTSRRSQRLASSLAPALARSIAGSCSLSHYQQFVKGYSAYSEGTDAASSAQPYGHNSLIG